MPQLVNDGWVPYGAGEIIKCPSTETVRRDDRRGGPLGARQILRRGTPTRWAMNDVPPLWERRRLVWPDGKVPTGPFQRTCQMTIGETGPGTSAFIRVIPTDHSDVIPRFLYLPAPPPSGTIDYRVCFTCGIRLEVVRIPTEIALRAG